MAADNDPASPSLRRERHAGALLALALELPTAEANYHPGRELAHGGMGSVLMARDEKLDRDVAMKVMLRPEAGEVERQRFLQEARVLGQLAHPNIVPIHDLAADEDGRLFFTMKLVQGGTLMDVLRQLQVGDAETLARYPLARLLTIFQKICDAMAFAHSRGIIHRDLKPQNIMVGEFGEVLVVDWGLAKILPGSPAEEAVNALSLLKRFIRIAPTPASSPAANSAACLETVADGGPSVPVPVPGELPLATNPGTPAPASTGRDGATLDGDVVGTPHYMSPEQAQGRVNEVDASSDIYALGGILYTLLTLRLPVEGPTMDDVLEKVRTGRITPPIGAGPVRKATQSRPLPHIPGGRVPEALSAVAMKALRLDKAQRYPDVMALIAELGEYQAGFATAAENAGPLKHLQLFLLRHRAVSAGLAVLLLLSVGFMLKLMSSERKAKRHEGIAQTKERQAIAEREVARQSLVRTALALAEAGLQDGNGSAMQAALQQVPKDLRDDTWSYLLTQSDTSIARVSTGAAEVQGVAAHPRRPGVFAVTDTDRKVTLLDVRTGARLLEFRPDLKLTTAPHLLARLAFAPDGERIAIGHKGASGGIVIHSAQDGKRLTGWAAPRTERLEFSPDGQSLLQIERDRTSLKMWDPATGQLRWSYGSGNTHVQAAFTPEGQVLTHGSEDRLRLVQAQDGALVRAFSGQWLEAFAIRPDGKMLVAVLRRGGIQGLSLEDGRVLYEDHPPQFGLRSARSDRSDENHLAFTPDGQRFVGVVALPEGRQAIQVWDAATGTPMQTLLGGRGRVNDVMVHPLSGELLVSGADARVWRLASSTPRWSLPEGARSIGFWGAEDIIFASAPGPGNAHQLQRLVADQSVPFWKPPKPSPHLCSTSADGRFAMLGPRRFPFEQKDYEVFFLREPGAQVERVVVPKPASFLDQLRLGPTGDRWATIQNHNRDAAVYGRPADAPHEKLEPGEILMFSDLAWLGSQRLVGLGTAKAARGLPGSEEWIALWDSRTGKLVQTATNHSAMDVLAAAPEGHRFAEAGEDRKVRVREAGTLRVLREFRAHNDRISALAWHPKQPILVTASEDLTVKLWDLETGRLLRELRGPITPPVRLALSPSGKRLACASPNDGVRIWELD